jgi:hypothetical protein
MSKTSEMFLERAKQFGQLSQEARRSGDYATAYAALADAVHWQDRANDFSDAISSRRLGEMQ